VQTLDGLSGIVYVSRFMNACTLVKLLLGGTHRMNLYFSLNEKSRLETGYLNVG
jgi:hypothetical protein